MHEPWWITIPKAFLVINVVMVFFAFTTWPRMWLPQTVHPAPNGSTLNAASAVNIDTIGARM
jgi:hypothetical protein